MGQLTHISILKELMYININKYRMSTANGTSSQRKILQINQRRDKYKRSTNNSHKKFICIARKLLYKYCREGQRELFQKEFLPHQNSRVFYFIILSHVKMRMNQCERQNYKKNLTTLLKDKIQTYNQEILNTNNKNFINFRFEEIADIQFAMHALNLYFQNRVPQAIEAIYKKEKGFVLKRQQYQMAIETILELQRKLKSYPQGELLPYLNQKPEGQESKKSSNKGKSKGKQDEEWVWEKQYRQIYKKSVRKQRKMLKKCQPVNSDNNTPLLFLQNSYEYNPHFFTILFNYQPYLCNFPSIPDPHPSIISKGIDLLQLNPCSQPQQEHHDNKNAQNKYRISNENCYGIDENVKRQQKEVVNYFGEVKSQLKEIQFLIVPQTTNAVETLH